jgi:hypothetical protein
VVSSQSLLLLPIPIFKSCVPQSNDSFELLPIIDEFFLLAKTYEDGGEGIEDPTGICAPEGDRKWSPWGMLLSRG